MTQLAPGLFTVVMSVWQRELYVPHAIQTVLWQTYANWELLIYADGPHPATQAMVAGLLAKRPDLRDRIRYIEGQPVPGTYGNRLRRQGLEEARGEYVCFLPHDCLLQPQYLETHAAVLAGQPCVSLVREDFWLCPRRGLGDMPEFEGSMPTKPPGQILPTNIDILCMAFRTQLARECDVFGEDLATCYAGDYWSFDRVRVKYPVIFTDKLLAAHF